MNKAPQYNLPLLILILLIGAWLRFDALTQDVRFHVDEAFFSTFARNAAVQGDWMLSGALDKSPLSLYASSVSMHFMGVIINDKNVLDLTVKTGEFSSRLPAVFAGIVSIALVYIIGRRIGGVWVGLFSAGIVACSPLMVSYSATAFTDTLMLMFLLMSLATALNRGAFLSGVMLALAFATKQQAFFYLPLFVGVMWLSGVRWRALLRFTGVLIAGVALLLLWDNARPETSIFALASVNNNPERFFVSLEELLPRAQIWLDVMAVGFGHIVLLVIAVMLAIYGGAYFKPQRRRERRENISGKLSLVYLIGLYIALYLLAHWLIAFNTYDRYLLPIMPLLALLVGCGLVCVLQKIEPQKRKEHKAYRNLRVYALIIICLLLIAFQRPFPEDNRRRDDDFIALMKYLNAKPLGTIVYDHWMGWQSGYYRGAWSDKRFVYYPDPISFADDAAKNPEQAPRYFIAPANVDIVLWIVAFNAGGFDAHEITDAIRSDDFLIYELILR